MRLEAGELERWTRLAANLGYLSLADLVRDKINAAARLAPLISSDDETTNTPPIVLDALRPMGRISLDPCSNERSIVPARTRFVLPAHDGLAEPWATTKRGARRSGLVFVNPPYGKHLPAWTAKIIAESRAGAEIVALVPGRIDARWYRDARRTCAARAEWRGRMRFLGRRGTAPFPVVIFYWGTRTDLFERALEGYADVTRSRGRRA